MLLLDESDETAVLMNAPRRSAMQKARRSRMTEVISAVLQAFLRPPAPARALFARLAYRPAAPDGGYLIRLNTEKIGM